MATSRVLAASIEWGTVGEWFGAIGAIGAGAIALWIAIRDGRERDRERRDAEAAQARCVIATVQHDREPRNLAGERNLRVRVANHSNAPITSIDILEITPVESWKIGRQPGRVGEFFAAAIPPGGETVSEPVELTGLPLIAESLPIERAVFARIQYVDSHGLVWERVGLDAPTRVLPDNHVSGRLAFLRGWNNTRSDG